MSWLSQAIQRGLRTSVSRGYTAGPAKVAPVLVRDWIADSLYNKTYGYFSNTDSPVGQLPHPIPFNTLSGHQSYQQQLRFWYDKLQVSWLTPAEIFHPHFGQAVARCILQEHSATQPLNIIEIGAGSGRLARDILDHLETEQPDIHANASYTSLEISSQLTATQQQKVLQGNKHTAQFQVVQQDAANALAWHVLDERPCVIVMMEVLDNMPHDRVWRPEIEAAWQETWLQPDGAAASPQEQAWKEGMRPASDPLLLACLQAAQQEQQRQALAPKSWLQALLDYALGASGQEGRAGPGEALWLPTTCLQLLQHLARSRPNHLLIAADFDQLPEVVIPGENAPLVASTVHGQTLDHASILAPRGTADIFFPTNFSLLQQLHILAQQTQGMQGHQVMGTICKSRSFMEQFANVASTCTASGYNPLLEDFCNTSFYIGKAGTCGW